MNSSFNKILVWRKEDGTTVLLLNEDESCKFVSGWKQFNNLAHYEIESDIEVSLLHRLVKGCFTSHATKGATGGNYAQDLPRTKV